MGDYGLTKVPWGSDGRDPRRPPHKRANAVCKPSRPSHGSMRHFQKVSVSGGCAGGTPDIYKGHSRSYELCGLEKRNVWVYAQIDVTIGRNTKRVAGAGGRDPATRQVTYASDPKSKREKKGTEMCHDRGEKHSAVWQFRARRPQGGGRVLWTASLRGTGTRGGLGECILLRCAPNCPIPLTKQPGPSGLESDQQKVLWDVRLP